MTFPVPMSPLYGRRRNRKAMIEEMRRAHQQWETTALEQNFKVEEAMQAIENVDMPEELKKLVRLQAENVHILPQPAGPVPTEAEFRRQELEQLADKFVGVYIERTADGFESTNFTQLLMAADSIRYSNDPARVTIFNAGDPFTKTGPAAVAFIRFLHYMGIFELEAAKKPCPECGDKPPQDCDTCGGLGWVI